MNFLSGRTVECLFKKDTFLNAINTKNAEQVKSDIRKTCSFHLDAMLITPVSKLIKSGSPDHFEKVRLQRTLDFEQETLF